MRIISQNRDISVEFDNVILKICNGSLICAYPYANQPEMVVIGKYESQERAAEVFEDLHNAYSRMPVLFQNIDLSDDVRELMKKCEVRGVITRCPDVPPKVEFVDNLVYRMPKE